MEKNKNFNNGDMLQKLKNSILSYKNLIEKYLSDEKLCHFHEGMRFNKSPFTFRSFHFDLSVAGNSRGKKFEE